MNERPTVTTQVFGNPVAAVPSFDTADAGIVAAKAEIKRAIAAAQSTPSASDWEAGAQTMREACAKWHDERADREREPVSDARDGEPNFIEGLQGFASMCDSGAVDKHDGSMLANKFRDAAAVISMLQNLRDEQGTELTRLRSSLATAERERASAVEQYERTHQELMGYVVRAEELGARAASLEALLTETRENQAASQRMTASVERSLDRSIALHEAAEALLAEAVPELGEMAAAAAAFPRYADSARVTVAMGACRRARALLTRIEAREGGEEKGR